MKQYKVVAGKLEVKFQLPGAEFTGTLNLIKSITGRKWIDAGKCWHIPDSTANRKLLDDNGFNTTEKTKESTPVGEFPIVKPVIAPVDKSLLPKDLHPYQIEAVGFLLGRGGSGLLADDVGLGKTLEALAYCVYAKQFPALIICPASVKTNWQREIRKWFGKDSVQLSGQVGQHIPKRIPFVIINYDILSSYFVEILIDKNGKEKKIRTLKDDCWLPILQDYGFKTVICDEAHNLKNSTALRTLAFTALADKIDNKIFLSATPIKNRTAEFYTILNKLDPKHFNNEYRFLHKFCGPKHNGFGWTYKGLTNEQELESLTVPLMLRRYKRDVLKDLPDRHILTIPMDMDNETMVEYKKASEAFLIWMQGEKLKNKEKKAHIETLRSLAYIGKRNSTVEWIENFLESDKKLIVMAWHTNVIDDLHNVFKKNSLVITGKTTHRQEIVDKFTNESKYQILIGQAIAAGVGLNIVCSSDVALVEPMYSPGDVEQLFGRVDRITQQADKVTLYHLVGEGTVDEDLVMLLDGKSDLIGRVMDGGNKANLFGGDIDDLLINLWKKKKLT